MRIALVGNQNSGKTTLFNVLTGSNQKVGNWPGVTIERKIGIIRGTDYELIDLPGIYSLSPYSVEENISRRFLFEEQVDLDFKCHRFNIDGKKSLSHDTITGT
jgi:ferrous iron transport protein B